MKELNRDELLKVLGGEGDEGDIIDPLDPDWSRCIATSYCDFY